ncbi:hypothetical protein DDD_1556 [Nonlabens dokdonensis DSW-6]|uniref:Uncharacterized protein n=1 Tax=Nonlabens dokdonensis (strain DSM 17205 / KCTC 12402 / DSW-6) TaxID=592029 RepID=L7WCP2_NONDD|nr:hypothetical protein DDD_1556 [Nonlabens dokdonensis DSW-6]
MYKGLLSILAFAKAKSYIHFLILQIVIVLANKVSINLWAIPI